MNDIKTLNKRYEVATWGILFLWSGVRDLFPGLPVGTGLLGVGLILLGLNLARYLSKIPMSGFSITLGTMAFVLGIVLLLSPVLNFPRFELPFFPVLLIVIGLRLSSPGPWPTEYSSRCSWSTGRSPEAWGR